MAGAMPFVPNRDGITKFADTEFKGLNHNKGAGDGEIWDETNMTSDYYPLAGSRSRRYTLSTLTTPGGIHAHNGLYAADGTKLRYSADGITWTDVATITAGEKQLCSLGDRIVILPDKLIYDTRTGTAISAERAWSGAATIRDGTYAGEEAEENTIYSASADWASFFKVGDAVTISGATAHPENNRTIIIREIDGHELRFYEHSFVIAEGGDTESNLSVARTMPEMDFICENENRIWGCKGSSIYASKLGDPTNWNVFDGLSTDSYQVDVGSAEDFTACCSYLGYPIFFKEEIIYKVYGEKPSAYQVMSSANLGVEGGSQKSLAVAGETLFYLSRAGVVAYRGGIPQSINAPLGLERYRNAVGGSDGIKYYMSAQNAETGAWTLLVYDTRLGHWHREDSTQALGWCWNEALILLTAAGKVMICGRPRSVPAGATAEETISSVLEFADFTEHTNRAARIGANRKGTGKLQLRLELEAGASVTVQIRFDSVGTWQTVSTLTNAANTKKSYYLPVIPRRNDHCRIKLAGSGQWWLYSLIRESYSGSEIH